MITQARKIPRVLPGLQQSSNCLESRGIALQTFIST